MVEVKELEEDEGEEEERGTCKEYDSIEGHSRMGVAYRQQDSVRLTRPILLHRQTDRHTQGVKVADWHTCVSEGGSFSTRCCSDFCLRSAPLSLKTLRRQYDWSTS